MGDAVGTAVGVAVHSGISRALLGTELRQDEKHVSPGLKFADSSSRPVASQSALGTVPTHKQTGDNQEFGEHSPVIFGKVRLG